jgi:hypothetical protein
MSTLWVRAKWEQDYAEDESKHPETRPVEKAGFAGWTSAPYLAEDGDEPHHHNEALMDHLLGHDGPELRAMSTPKRVSLNEPIYATQSHVTEQGLLKHMMGAKHTAPEDQPRFVRHQGRLYVDDGHHRVGAALLRGDSSIQGYHYDADKKGFPEPKEDW